MKSIHLLALLLALPGAASAENISWLNPGGGSWFDGANWSTTTVPTIGDNVGLSLGTALVGAPGAQAAQASIDQTGAVRVESGGTWSVGALFTGMNTGLADSLTVTGVGSALEIRDQLRVGYSGAGQMTVSGGATATSGFTGFNSIAVVGGMGAEDSGTISERGAGTVTVTGTGSTWDTPLVLVVGGLGGSGSLNVLDGGTVNVTLPMFAPAPFPQLAIGGGNDAATVGSVRVSGTGSTIALSFVNIGRRFFGDSNSGPTGTGNLTVDAGGLVDAIAVLMGPADPATDLTSAGHIFLNGTEGSRGVLQTPSIDSTRGTVDFDGGILRVAGGATDLLTGFATGDVTLGAGGGFIDTNGNAATLSAPLDGPGQLTKLGAGTLTLSGVNTFMGGLDVEAGTLLVGSATALPTGSALVVNGGILDLDEHDIAAASLGGNGGAVDIDQAVLTIDQAAGTTFNGIVGGEGSLVKEGVGQVYLGGANTYTGGTTIKGGSVVAGDGLALGTGVVTLDGGGAVLEVLDGLNIANDLVVGAQGGSVTNYGAFARSTISGSIALGGDFLVRALSEAPARTTIGGNIAGTGAVTLYTPEQATIVLSGTSVNQTGQIIHTGEGTGAATIQAVIGANVTGVTQDASSPLILTADNLYVGPTLVNQGKLVVDGRIKGTTTVAALGTLSGTGTIGDATVNGTLAPGDDGVGLLTFTGSLTLNTGSVVSIEIGGEDGALFDRLSVGNILTYGGALTISLTGGFVPQVGDTFQIFTTAGAPAGTFAEIGFSDPGFTGTFDYANGILTIASVPEPSTWALFTCALIFSLVGFRARAGRNA